jgi:hypothetical protein
MGRFNTATAGLFIPTEPGQSVSILFGEENKTIF